MHLKRIQICKDLIDEGAYLVIHDPKVNENQILCNLQTTPSSQLNKELEITSDKKIGKWIFARNLDIFDDAHAVLILTEWEEYKNIKWNLVAPKMIRPGWVFDARSIVDRNKVKDAGLKLWLIGDGSENEKINF